MLQPTGPFIAIAPSDSHRDELNDLPLPVAVLSVDEAGAPIARLADTSLSQANAYAQMVGMLVLSPEAATEAAAIADAWSARFGTDLPPTLDLSQPQDAPRTAILSWLVATLADGRATQAARNVQLQRDLGALRSVHEATQTAFSRLETYVYKLGGPARTLAFQLEPIRSRPPVTLQNKDRAEQRLPMSSAGLSDVAVSIAERPGDADGQLDLSLELQESGEIVAEWTVPAAELQEGWLRLSRAVSLATDRQTVILRVQWQGSSQLKLSQTIAHPDPRFRVSRNSVPQEAVLAAAGWSCVAGTSLPHPAGAWADRIIHPRRWIVPTQALREAHSASPDGTVAYSDALGGLTVTPTSAGPAIARISGAGVPGMQQIICGVETKADAGPTVEYALAILPAEPDRSGPIGVAALAAGTMTDWVPLPVARWAEIQLFLEAPLDAPSDICVLTRLQEADIESETAVPDDLRCCVFNIRANA
ncbi:DUF6212 domain-containing protein [Tropicimonas sediminicola]|uniref:Uncharacterized protein n=1 Tax=Tropicimonas sediminicola TaxID=1031541 RepID=A0A239EGG8_9RHOB|nr:DUF6212 domain-containing protein [Tropicimonas sediminicola]SNS43755.1 hypothetical protein SAMN05421757_102142 [Tropicimonas sediminicola]